MRPNFDRCHICREWLPVVIDGDTCVGICEYVGLTDVRQLVGFVHVECVSPALRSVAELRYEDVAALPWADAS
jgi:hypothetical protein